MKVLVTGATGFIGSQLARALVGQGHQVRVLRRASSKMLMLDGLAAEHVLGDILEPETLGKAIAGAELVFHVAALASYWRAQRDQVYNVNVRGTHVEKAYLWYQQHGYLN